MERSFVGRIFGWAKNSLAQLKLEKENPYEKYNAVKDITNTAVIAEISDLFLNHKFKEVIKYSFDYCRAQNETVFLNIRGLAKKKNGFEATSFTLKSVNGVNQILKITYENNDFSSKPNIEPISADEFIDFCEEKYKDDIVNYKTVYTYAMEQYAKKFGRNVNQDKVKKVVDEFVASRPALFSVDRINKMHENMSKEVEKYIFDNLMPPSAKELMQDDNIPVKNIKTYRHDEER